MMQLRLSSLAMAIAVTAFSDIGNVVVGFTGTTTTVSFPRAAARIGKSQRERRTKHPLFVSNSNNNNNNKETAKEGEEESEEDFERRMAVVRSLQMSFYGASASKNDGDPKSSDGGRGDALDDERPPEYRASTGTIQSLPIFRAAWYELPGRSNVLILRDPMYTNMFEKMFYKPINKKLERSIPNSISPWIFGHLFTPKDSEDETKPKKKIFKKKGDDAKTSSSDPPSAEKNNNSSYKGSSKSKRNKLTTWKDTNRSTDLSSTSVLGTLMYVRDYRRLKDGRILALVQAAETFVVEDVRRSLPYAIVDVKLLPDVEELGLHNEGMQTDESSSSSFSIYSCGDHPDEQSLVDCLKADEVNSAGSARAKAVLKSIQSFHDYECDVNQRLDGIPDRRDLGILDITHDAISKANLPYCPFSEPSSLNATTTTTETINTLSEKINLDSRKGESDSPADTSLSPSLELQLLRKGITKIPPSDRRFSYNTEPTYSSSSTDTSDTAQSWTTDELEYQLWLVIDYFSTITNKEISPVLMGLLPRDDQLPKSWPADFSLKKAFDEKYGGEKNQYSISKSYPKRRRQRRLSYSAAYLLEAILPIGTNGNDNFRGSVRSSCATAGVDEVEIQELRALLLSVPSTRQRLRVVLEKFHQWRFYQECNEFA
mmetsp:Transcript_27468/g.75080  ORF Transcript_27468/g.75080 Transcript_27468/m.75080 type:complete len:656 (-) Transcript_27468:329-2296(-)